MNEKKEEIEGLKYSYDRVLDTFRLHNDNYFKRIQIIMVAIQVGLFFVIIKLLRPIPDLQKELILPIIVTLLGLAIAWMWRVLMTRQMQYMEFLKKYLRNLETRFKELDVPIDYYNIESAISGHSDKDPQITTARIIDSEGGRLAEFKWSGEECPEKWSGEESPENGKKSDGPNWFVRKGWLETSDIHKIGVPRGNMVLIEKRLSMGIQWFWLLGFIALLTWFFYC